MARNTPALGMILMITTTFIFAIQDGISRHLAGHYNVFMIVMIRYWFFLLFTVLFYMRTKGGLAAVVHSSRPWLQFFRGALLALEILLMITAFVRLGLVAAPAIFSVSPLLVTALSGPILGEKIGLGRWSLVMVGFAGVLIIIQPGSGLFTFDSIFAIGGAFCYALYGLLNRYVAQFDRAETTFFYTGLAGAVLTTMIGMWHWEAMLPIDWFWLGVLCAISLTGHFLLIKAYEVAEAAAIQPFAYFQLPFSAVLGVFIFGDLIKLNVFVGALIVVGAGVITFLRTHKRRAQVV